MLVARSSARNRRTSRAQNGARVTTIEQDWLRYAWRVVSCDPMHRRACEAAGGARAALGREPGNDLRWPGYLGRNYAEGRGVLCIGHVHRERVRSVELTQAHSEATEQLVGSVRSWLRTRRSPGADATFLASVRREYEQWLPTWRRWNHPFGDLVRGLGMDVTHIAWANLAKCRVPIDDKASVDRVIRLCQVKFPIAELIGAIRPAAVFVCVLRAGEGGPIVKTWRSGSETPLVYPFDGRRSTNERGERLGVWGPRAIREIRRRIDAARPS